MSYPDTMSEIANYPKALSHAGSGGGNVVLKTITVKNNTSGGIYLCSYIDETGKYVKELDEPEIISAGDEVTVSYVEPTEGDVNYWLMEVNTTVQAIVDEAPEGVDVDGYEMSIWHAAADGTTVTFKDASGPN